MSSGSLCIQHQRPHPIVVRSPMEPVEMESLQTLSWTDAQSNTVQYKVAKFSFDSV